MTLTTPLQQAIKTLRPRLIAENVSLTLKGDINLIVAGESSQLETIFINLLSNSINALHQNNPPRKIDVRVSSINGNGIVVVSDNGPGIAASMLPNLCQLYATGDEKGTGVGLWLSQQLAQSSGGNIEAGNNENGGAWFRVSLPIKTQ